MNTKKITLFLLLFFVVSGIAGSTSAQSPAAQKALEGVKESVDTLINAKDENNPNETAFRTETFKKVIDFSIVELKELRVKFLAAIEEQKNGSTTIGLWREHILSEINKTAEFYEIEKEKISNIKENTDAEKIKNDAENFKKWREENFSPLAQEINDFLLVEQQKKSLNTTENRWEKIKNDVLKLKKAFSAKKVQEIENLLNDSQKTNVAAKETYEKAYDLFYTTYLAPFEEKNATTTPLLLIKTTPIEEKASSTISDFKDIADGNTSSTESVLEPSIRDLIKDSLTNVKRTYQIFIEMSGLVRKLLM